MTWIDLVLKGSSEVADIVSLTICQLVRFIRQANLRAFQIKIHADSSWRVYFNYKANQVAYIIGMTIASQYRWFERNIFKIDQFESQYNLRRPRSALTDLANKLQFVVAVDVDPLVRRREFVAERGARLTTIRRPVVHPLRVQHSGT